MLDCPSDLILARLGHDTLDVVQRTAIEEHVQRCEKCVGVLEKLVSHGTATAPESASLPAEENLPNIPGFAIEGEIGRGGMGVVYRACEPKLARTVALKIVRSGPMTGSRERKRWLSEARCGTRVCHPNVVQLHDADEADGWLYLVLEFVPGGSLRERLGGPLPARAAAELMMPVAAAMTAVHAAGLLHLDLKPSNILLDSSVDAAWKDACPKVADFGLARPLADPGASSTSMAGPWGTPSYMAPEQIAGDRAVLGPATDVYALGAILYELLAGHPPFQGASTLDTLDQVRGQQPVPPRRLNPKIPRDLETITLKCLEKIPSRRYASAEAMADDLRRWLDGKPIAARPVSTFEKSWSWCRRHPAIAALVTTLLTTFSVGFVTMVLLWTHAEAERNRAEQERTFADRERNRAETGYGSACAALALILDQGTTGLRSTGLATEQFIARAQTERKRILDLAELRSSDLEVSKLAYLDVVLRQEFDSHGKTDEARLLNAESLLYWEKILRRDPFDQFAQHRRFESAASLARLMEGQGNAEDALRHWQRASQLGEFIVPAMSVAELGALAECRRSIAGHVDRLGDHERARTILEGMLRILGNVPAKNATPEFYAHVAKTQFELGRIIQRFSLREIDHLTAEDWADRVARFLSSIFTTDSMRPLKESEAGYWFIFQSLDARAAAERRTGKLDDARRTVDRIHALAKLLVVRYPDQAAAHLSLTEEFSQRAKNAWQSGDRVAIERNLRQALDESRHALRLDPQNAWAESLVIEFQRRLNNLLASHEEAVAQVPSDRAALKIGTGPLQPKSLTSLTGFGVDETTATEAGSKELQAPAPKLR